MIVQNKITGIEYDLSSPKRALRNSIYGVLVYGESSGDKTPYILFMWGNDDEVEFVYVTNEYNFLIPIK